MRTPRLRFTVVGGADALQAMRRWLASNSPIPVTFKPTHPGSRMVTIRLVEAAGARGRMSNALVLPEK